MDTLTLQEVIDRIDTFTGDERAEYLPRLMKVLCPVSFKQIENFQDAWDGTRPFEEFRKAQDKELVGCIQIEVSEFGTMTRAALNMPPLTLDTKI